ncbi:MAG: porin family protein [Bacteroidota bacterium]|nr:porin family protein [Bacteroidota bacterium]
MKVLKKIIRLTLFVIFLYSGYLFGQAQANINLPKYDRHKIHFGFLLGFNTMNFVTKPIQINYRPDSVLVVQSLAQSGFNIGIISSLRLGEYWDLRFVPDLAFGQRNIEYTINVGDTLPTKAVKKIESTYINFPFTFKYKSSRYNNFRAYVLGGGRISLDLASMIGKKNTDEEYIKLSKINYALDVGTGVDFYLEYFKFSIEIKMSYGLNDLLKKDETIYTQTIDKLCSKIFLLSFNFE